MALPSGTMKITTLLVVGNNGERIYCNIKRVMDYSELLNSTAETMTTKVEDLSAGHRASRKINETPQILENMNTGDKNLHTGGDGVIFYLKDGSPYQGAYHIHLKDSSCMTGAVHNENSQDLYFKQVFDGEIIDKLIPTRNPSGKPPGLRLQKRRLARITTREKRRKK